MKRNREAFRFLQCFACFVLPAPGQAARCAHCFADHFSPPPLNPPPPSPCALAGVRPWSFFTRSLSPAAWSLDLPRECRDAHICREWCFQRELRRNTEETIARPGGCSSCWYLFWLLLERAGRPAKSSVTVLGNHRDRLIFFPLLMWHIIGYIVMLTGLPK